MNVYIKDSGKIEVLELMDWETSINHAQDYIGNEGGLHGDFVRDEHFVAQLPVDGSGNVWICDQEAYEYWSAALDEAQQDLNEERGIIA